jgi:hypothetical protein
LNLELESGAVLVNDQGADRHFDYEDEDEDDSEETAGQ